MLNRWWTGGLVAAALFAGSAGEALASYPTAVWTRVSKVVYDNPQDPTTVQIYGAFMLYVGGSSGKYLGYTDPAEGYMYYVCPVNEKATCQMEWKEIEANIDAPKDECQGFGDQMTPPGKLRGLCDVPKDPDQYPIAMGTFPGFSPCQVVNEYLATNPETMCGGSSSSSSTGTGGSTSSTTGTGGSTTSSTTGTGGSTTGTGGGTTTAATTGAGGSTTGTGGSATGGNGNVQNKGSCSIGGAGGETSMLGLAVLALGSVLLRKRRGARAGQK